MEKLKFYINNEADLTDYEKENKRISYATLTEYLFSDMIMCNNIEGVLNQLGDFLIDNIVSGKYSLEDEGCEIYQYFIVDFKGSCNYDFLEKYCQNEIILYYSNELDIYILGVDHWGTNWKYILTDFEYTTEYENSMQDKLYKEGE